MRERSEGLLGTVAWIGAVVVIALGAAGVVAAMDAPPISVPRPELTAEGDAIVGAALDASESDLRGLAEQVDQLAGEARGALASLNGRDLDEVGTAVATGDELVNAIREDSAAIAAGLASVPLLATTESAYRVSPEVRDRRGGLEAALQTTQGLDAAWARLTIGSLAASRMAELLGAHDDAVLRATDLGRGAEYDLAVEALGEAETAIDAARGLRDGLSQTVDVTTLDQMLDRSETYDAALRDLYVELDRVGGRVTKKLQRAIAAEKAARDRLPPDARGLSLVMADIGQGGMTGAVIAIEEAKGRLTAALLEAVEPGRGTPRGPAASPDP